MTLESFGNAAAVVAVGVAAVGADDDAEFDDYASSCLVRDLADSALDSNIGPIAANYLSCCC